MNLKSESYKPPKWEELLPEDRDCLVSAATEGRLITSLSKQGQSKVFYITAEKMQVLNGPIAKNFRIGVGDKVGVGGVRMELALYPINANSIKGQDFQAGSLTNDHRISLMNIDVDIDSLPPEVAQSMYSDIESIDPENKLHMIVQPLEQ